VKSADAPFMALRRGPIVMARDARLGQPVDGAVKPCLEADGSVRTEAWGPAPFKSLISLAVCLADGGTMPMVDYASAGKTWQEDSKMCAWFPAK